MWDSLKPEWAQSGFATTGLVPLNRDAIPDDMIAPSRLFPWDDNSISDLGEDRPFFSYDPEEVPIDERAKVSFWLNHASQRYNLISLLFQLSTHLPVRAKPCEAPTERSPQKRGRRKRPVGSNLTAEANIAQSEQQERSSWCAKCLQESSPAVNEASAAGIYGDNDKEDELWVRCSKSRCSLWFHVFCTSLRFSTKAEV
jgi:hypothetical protein